MNVRRQLAHLILIIIALSAVWFQVWTWVSFIDPLTLGIGILVGIWIGSLIGYKMNQQLIKQGTLDENGRF